MILKFQYLQFCRVVKQRQDDKTSGICDGNVLYHRVITIANIRNVKAEAMNITQHFRQEGHITQHFRQEGHLNFKKQVHAAGYPEPATSG